MRAFGERRKYLPTRFPESNGKKALFPLCVTSSKKQLSVLPRTFHVDIPDALSEEIMKCKTDKDVEKVGGEWLLEQSKELKKSGGASAALLHAGQIACYLQCGEGPLTLIFG